MRTRVSISFPYNSKDPAVFDKLLALLRGVSDQNRPINTSDRKPLMIVNTDTLERGGYDAFLRYLEDRHQTDVLNTYEMNRIRATDTCQMWIHGWDTILEESKVATVPDESILQLPGDLKDVRANFNEFLSKIRDLRLKLHEADFVIGDFDTDPLGAKALIDTYGTLPLLLTWFPHVAARVRGQYRISRPRSEFIAASTGFMQSMLSKRKFAYEQTLTLLIYAIEFPRFGTPPNGAWRIERVEMGLIADHGEHRGFREAVDQIERTERMLRALWREMNSDAEGFSVEEFERLDLRSTAMRETAMIILENYLTVGKPKVTGTASGRTD